MRHKVFTLLMAFIVASLSLGAYGADQSPAAHVKKQRKKMKMDEPMTTPMMKQGMIKGDVKNSANRKAREMQPMMEQDEKSMPQDKTKP
ncbi:MAG TPA: hypothetical protein VFF82_07885 [Rhodocyclaceae bacterium]|nr:hypothetical protein [Rhodocyclaceae bacterium]